MCYKIKYCLVKIIDDLVNYFNSSESKTEDIKELDEIVIGQPGTPESLETIKISSTAISLQTDEILWDILTVDEN